MQVVASCLGRLLNPYFYNHSAEGTVPSGPVVAMLQVLCAEQQELASGAEDVTELLFFLNVTWLWFWYGNCIHEL